LLIAKPWKFGQLNLWKARNREISVIEMHMSKNYLYNNILRPWRTATRSSQPRVFSFLRMQAPPCRNRDISEAGRCRMKNVQYGLFKRGTVSSLAQTKDKTGSTVDDEQAFL
jgi:hypothetical protein